MKDMKKAVAEFRTSCIALLAEVAVQPSRLADFPVRPKAKSLHVIRDLRFVISPQFIRCDCPVLRPFSP